MALKEGDRAMPEVLYTGQLTGLALKKLINDCTFQKGAYFLGEQLPIKMVSDDDKQNLMCFTRYTRPDPSQLDSSIPFDNYTTGRVFQEDRELRWEREGNQFRVVYLGSELDIKELEKHGCQKYPDFTKRLSEGGFKKKEQTYFLFGKFLKEHVRVPEGSIPYAEARIARILYYPPAEQAGNTKPATRVGIKVAEYIDSESGQIFAYRFQSLQAMD
jgi:hypothetical protein